VPTMQGEYVNVALLILLYTLQGIPMGLCGFVSLEVKSIFKDSFSEQGTFMFAYYPFSLKLLWAPLVDTWYSERLGRRKTWMVPAQFAIGLLFLLLAPRIDDLFEARDVMTLTCAFFTIYFLCATQDIAVDGWALTMLRPENSGYAATCNAVGQTLGSVIGLMVPMGRVMSLETFLSVCGTVFLATTVVVAAFKREAPTSEEEALEGIAETFRHALSVVRRPPVRLLVVLLFTRALAFIPADVMAAGRLQDLGFPMESLAFIKLLMTPIELVLPMTISRWTAGRRPLTVILKAYIPRAMLSIACGVITYSVGDIPQPVPIFVYCVVAALMIVQGVLTNAIFVAHMGFFAKVSDPSIGGTYMTLLNTLHNLGNMWASTFCLKASDRIRASTGLDGFYVLCGLCGAYGVLWFLVCAPKVRYLQDLPAEEWRIA